MTQENHSHPNRPANSVDLVIFDCDGVLVDSELLGAEADVACLADEGFVITLQESLDRYSGNERRRHGARPAKALRAIEFAGRFQIRAQAPTGHGQADRATFANDTGNFPGAGCDRLSHLRRFVRSERPDSFNPQESGIV